MKQLEFPTARTTDPSTSHKAGAAVKVRAGSQQYTLLLAYAEHKYTGLTDEEAGIHTGLDQLPRCCYWKRCSELRQAGYIEATNDERLSTAGQPQRVCVITAEGLKVLL